MIFQSNTNNTFNSLVNIKCDEQLSTKPGFGNDSIMSGTVATHAFRSCGKVTAIDTLSIKPLFPPPGLGFMDC
ncbi:hypothetical protein Y032_0012g1818 [Ancylostoma ceylanicum]|nr:hypothetical protein Y032_0012g1818 [Ancylostoma ceylanicum]